MVPDGPPFAEIPRRIHNSAVLPPRATNYDNRAVETDTLVLVMPKELMSLASDVSGARGL